MLKKFYTFVALITTLVLLGFPSIVSNAQEVETGVTKNEVTLEEAQKNVQMLTEDQKKNFRGQKDLSKLIPSLTEDLYFNDFSGMYDSKKFSKEIETILKNAEDFEKEKVKIVIVTVDTFSDIDPTSYAGAFYDVNELEDSIVIAISKEEEVGIFAINNGSFCLHGDFDTKSSEAIKTFCKSNKEIKDIIKFQTSLIKIYSNIYLKSNKLLVDNEDIFSDEELKDLEKLSEDYKEKSGIGICVLTVSEKDTLSEEIYDQYSKEDTWIFIVLSTEEKTLDVLWKKEADEYITKVIVSSICKGVESDLEAKEYKNAVSSLQENLIKHLELYGANIENNVGLSKVSLKFD